MPLRADESFLSQLERYREAGVNIVSLNVGMADVPMREHVRVLSFMRRWITQSWIGYQQTAWSAGYLSAQTR